MFTQYYFHNLYMYFDFFITFDGMDGNKNLCYGRLFYYESDYSFVLHIDTFSISRDKEQHAVVKEKLHNTHFEEKFFLYLFNYLFLFYSSILNVLTDLA